MPGELIQQSENLLALAADKGMGEILKPLSRQIHLFDTYIAGVTTLKDPSVLDAVSVGMPLVLQREESKFDSNAILVLTRDRRKLGYIPEQDELIFARLMDAGKLLSAQVRHISDRGSYRHIAIDIYLVDF